MQELAVVDVHVKDIINGPVRVVQWTKTDPFPQLGSSVGVDTETELITETNSAPPLVVLGVFDLASATCYISYWEDAAVFINRLSKCEIQQHYFNLGFDEHVLNDVDEEKALMDAIELGRVRDMQIRIQLNDIATIGFIPYNHYSLKDCSKLLLGIELDKGEAYDPESHRLTFRRGTPITQEQAIYLAWDCISTECLAQITPEAPTEVQHSKGMVVLAHISHNGFDVDPVVYKAFEDKLQAAKDEYRMQLLSFGFPDPYQKNRDENAEYKEFVINQATAFCMLADNDKPLNLCKANARMALVYAFNFENDAEHTQDLEESVAFWLTQEKPKNLRKAEQKVYNEMLDECDQLEAFFTAGKDIVMNALLGYVLQDLLAQQETKITQGYNLKHAFEKAAEILDDNPHWTDNSKQIGPKTFLQQHYQNLLDANPKLELPTTDGGDYKLTLNDKWRLDDLGIKDPFLNAYTNYRHHEKFLSTYFNHEHLKADGKVHPRYVSLLRTGRTSATAPPIQTLPSRESVLTLKNMFVPPKGAILCATDFSFVELCGFAQSCYDRFGFSVMRDVINAGIDPHRWFAGVMNKIITPDLKNKDDPEWVAKISAFLEEHVTKKQRQDAKAANFGLPGGMQPKRFYQHCRSMGIEITMQQAEEMCRTWEDTFSEMKQHKIALPSKMVKLPYNAYGLSSRGRDGDELEEDEDPAEQRKHAYRSILKCGQLRERCSFNSSLNYQFQALVALGAKLAGWNLVYNGYQDRMTCFVHDEFLYWLWPNELQTHIPIIEKLMLQGMGEYITDVKVGVESSCMLRWDKKAKTFDSLEWAPDGLPILEEPPFVQELHKALEAQKEQGIA